MTTDRDREAFEAGLAEYKALMEFAILPADPAAFQAGWQRALSHARAAGEAEPGASYERCPDCSGSGMLWVGEDVTPCPECKGNTVVPAQEPVAVPAGWKLVPTEPTPEMIDAWHRASWPTGPSVSPLSQQGLAFVRYYDAMLAASPVAPTADGGEVDCQKCAGNGEIVTDWDRYLKAKPGDVGDEAVAECPECSGTGKVDAAPQPADHRRVQDAAPARPELDALFAEAKAQAPQPGGAVKQRVLERISVFASYSPEEGESWESWYHSAFDLLASEVAALEPSPSQWNAGAEATDWRERDLDLIAAHEKAEAFKAGAKAMREDCAKWHDNQKREALTQINDPTTSYGSSDALLQDVETHQYSAEIIRALPLPTPPAGEGS